MIDFPCRHVGERLFKCERLAHFYWTDHYKDYHKINKNLVLTQVWCIRGFRQTNVTFQDLKSSDNVFFSLQSLGMKGSDLFPWDLMYANTIYQIWSYLFRASYVLLQYRGFLVPIHTFARANLTDFLQIALSQV